MNLTLEGLKDREAFEKAGISVPNYDIVNVQRAGRAAPVWVHFGVGNIFRGFIGGIADGLIEKGLMSGGLTAVETFDYDIVDKIYRPFDNLSLNVIMNADGTRDIRVIGSLAEAVKADRRDEAQWARLKEIFTSASLQLVSFTITEKGYALKSPSGEYLPFVSRDIAWGPELCSGAMAILTAMLYERFKAGAFPIALVSMDNCAQNGRLLKSSVCAMAREWLANGFMKADFLAWLESEENVAFDSTMIDKITPRPGEAIAQYLADLGLENMEPIVTQKRTYIAPFVNSERAQYLVIEDRFPNGRPKLEEGFGVYMGDYDTVRKSERMKVTACLNPAHTAVGPLGVVLGQTYFADMLRDIPVTLRMAKQVVYDEGMPVVEDPVIISPKAFADEVFERFTNLYLGDTNLRLATDASQGLGVRFGETIKAYTSRYGSAECLTAIPLGIAGYFRYLMGIDDRLGSYELAPDPLAEEIHRALSTVVIGEPDSLTDQLRPYLSNESLFHTDLYAAGVGRKVENMFREMVAGPGAVMKTIEKYIK